MSDQTLELFSNDDHETLTELCRKAIDHPSTSPKNQAADHPEVIEWRYNKLLSLGASEDQARKSSKDQLGFVTAKIYLRGK